MANKIVCDRCGKVIGLYNARETRIMGDDYDFCSDCYHEVKNKFREWLESEKPDDGLGGRPKKKRIFRMFGGL